MAQDYRIYEIPISSILKDGKKVKYFEFLSSLENEECNRALKRIKPKIDIAEIYQICRKNFIKQ